MVVKLEVERNGEWSRGKSGVYQNMKMAKEVSGLLH